MRKNDAFVTVNYISKNDMEYKVGITRKKANKRTVIKCNDNHVVWEQIYPLGWSPVSEETIICQPSSFLEKGIVCILVISGKPAEILGLEEGAFLSAQSWNRPNSNKLYVMTEKAFSNLHL